MAQAQRANRYPSSLPVSSGSQAAIVSGCVVSCAIITFLLIDGAVRLSPLATVTDAIGQVGFFATPELARSLGMLASFARCPAPGRAGSPLFSHVLFGFSLGVTVFSLFLRGPRLRAVPLQFFK